MLVIYVHHYYDSSRPDYVNDYPNIVCPCYVLWLDPARFQTTTIVKAHLQLVFKRHNFNYLLSESINYDRDFIEMSFKNYWPSNSGTNVPTSAWTVIEPQTNM